MKPSTIFMTAIACSVIVAAAILGHALLSHTLAEKAAQERIEWCTQNIINASGDPEDAARWSVRCARNR